MNGVNCFSIISFLSEITAIDQSSARRYMDRMNELNQVSGKNVQTVAPSHPKNSKLYKTELCRTWMDCGRCNYGDK